jgi:acetyl-CoA acetyltransferase
MVPGRGRCSMTNRSVSRKTAIVGIGSTPYAEMYRAPGNCGTALESALTATAAAIEDAGLRKSDIDGVMVGGLPNYESFMLRAGLTDVRFVAYYPRAGRLCPLALAQAAAAVESEMANYVVLFNAVEFRSAGRRFGESEDVVRSGRRPTAHMETSYGLAYGMSTPGANYALAYSRYKSEHGLADDALGAVAVSSGQWASMNPDAILREKISIEDYRSSPYIAEPLRRFDYCLVNDGCAAYVVTTADRAKDLPHTPVLVASTAGRATIREYYASEDFWAEACRSLKNDLLDGIGLTLADIDAVSVYDNFSTSIVWMLEGFGFAAPGEALARVVDGWISPGGQLPVNTSGGMLSESYLQGWNNHVENVRQLRGDAGARQIAGCRTILYAGLSAVPAGDVLVRGD